MEVEQKVEGGMVVTTCTVTREDILEERVKVLEQRVASLTAALSDLAHYVRYGNCA